MASLIYVTHSQILVRRVPLALISFLQSSDKMLFAAVIKSQDEPSPESGKLLGFSWHEPLKLGSLEVIVTKSSQFNVHEPVPSDSDDSDAHYFGENNELGMLLQYLGPDAWRTKDAVAHTSVHHHEEGRETYYLLDGAASIEWRDVRTEFSRPVSQVELKNQRGAYLTGFTVPPYVQHPVVASSGTHSVMLLVTNPPNNTRSDHHQDGLFRDVFPEVIASYTQRTHGLSAKVKEGGSPQP